MEEYPVSSVSGSDIHYQEIIRAMFIIKARSGYPTSYISFASTKLMLPNDRNHDFSDHTINEECDPFTRRYA